MKKIKNFLFSKPFFLIVLLGLSLALFAALFAHAYIGSFSRYLADDFCTSGKLNSLGFWQAQQFWYTHWSGRFSFTFLVSVLESLGPMAPKVLPALYCAFLLAAAYVLINSLSKRFLSPIHSSLKLFFAAFFGFMLLYGIPGIGQDLYWMTGAATYLAPIILGLFLFSGLITLTDPKKKLTPLQYWPTLVVVLLLVLFNSGFSEVATVLQTVIMLVVILAQKWILPQKKWSLLWIFAFVITLIGMALMIFAPGNANRQAALPDHPNLVKLIFLSVKFGATYILLWFLKNTHLIWPGLILLSAAAYFGFRNIPARKAEKPAATEKTYLLGTLFLFALVFLSFVPSAWATGQGAEDRVLILPSVFLTLFILGTGVFLGAKFSVLIKEDSFHGASAFFLALFLGICLHFVLSVPLYQAKEVYDLKGEAAAFAAAWDGREEIIQAQLAEGKTNLEVPPVEGFIGLEPLREDPSHWINICAAEYYQVESIRVVQP